MIKYIFEGKTEYNNSIVQGSLIQYDDGTCVIMSYTNPYSFKLEHDHGMYRHLVHRESVKLISTEDDGIIPKEDMSLPITHNMYDCSYCICDCITECGRRKSNLNGVYTTTDFSKICSKYRQKYSPLNSIIEKT